MTDGIPLRCLSVKGFTSLSDATLDITSAITLLVGANGAGKSNIVDAFEILGRIVDGQLNDHLVRRGGLTALLYRSPEPALAPDSIELQVTGERIDGECDWYRAVISSAAEDQAVLEEFVHDHDQAEPERPLGVASESQLRSAARTMPAAKRILEVIANCRVFHFDDTSPDAPPKKRTDVVDSLMLRPDAGNISALLLRLRDADVARYQRIVRSVRTVAPYFDDFVLEPEHGSILLRWRERGLDGIFSADALSSGTLRFICLSVLLLQDGAPNTIILDEPELGQHPFAIHQLAELMRIAAAERRIIAATQSVTLLSQFSVDEVAIVERASAGTVIHRPDRESLNVWLDDYSLGELWEKNVLGGFPGSDGASHAIAR